MDNISVKVNGKINLSLNILGRESDFHALDMVMVSVDIFDLITLSKRMDDNINVVFSNGFTGESVAKKIAIYLQQTFHLSGFDAFINVNIPTRGGMGGSSADGAGIINGVNKLFDLNLSLQQMQQIGMIFGSDIPYMIKGGYARVMGRGEKVEYFDCDSSFYLIALFDDMGVNTRECFSLYDSSPIQEKGNNDILINALINNDIKNIIDNIHNDLLNSGMILNENIKKNMDMLEKANSKKVFMTGSGATTLALFDNKNDCIEQSNKIKNSKILKTQNEGISFIY